MGQRKTTTRFNITDYWGKTSKLRWILHFRLEFFFFALITHNTHLWFQYSCHGMQKVPMKLCEKQTVCTYDNVYLVFKIDKCITIVPNEQPMNWRSGFTSRKIKKKKKKTVSSWLLRLWSNFNCRRGCMKGNFGHQFLS